jgi:hypothetical protein
MLPPDLRARVLDATRGDPAPTRESGQRRRTLTLALGFAAAVVVGGFLGRPDVAPRPVAYFAFVLAAWACVAALATWTAVSRGRSMLGRPTPHRLAVALLTPTALIAVALLGNLVWPETLDDGSGLVAHSLCAGWVTLFAVGPLVAFAIVGRRADPVAPATGGAALGAAAGAWGALGIDIFCSRAAPTHVFFGHVLPVVLLAGLGAVVGDRVLRVVAVRAKNG